MKTLIIEDDTGALNRLRACVDHFCPQLKVAGEGRSVAEGFRLIHEKTPDLVFLDIRLPDGTGFDLIDKLESVNFHLIFITAYDDYAIKAFEYHAVHYILKPFLPEDIVKAVSRAERQDPVGVTIKTLIPSLRPSVKATKIAIPSVTKINYINTADILQCESDGPYTVLYLEDGSQLISTRPLKEYDTLLEPFGFYRIHRSHLINLDKVSEYRKGSMDAVILKDGTVIEVSRKKRKGFLLAMSLH